MFTKRYPSGVPALQAISPEDFEYWDDAISKSVDGTAGGVYGGPIELTGALLSGTSEINTEGNIVTEQDMQCAFLTVTNDATMSDVSADSVLVDDLNAIRVFYDRQIPDAIDSASIDVDGATVASFDFISKSHFEIELYSGGSPTATARLATTCTCTDTSGTAGLRCKPGEKKTIIFKAKSTQTGGIGLTPGIFPSNFRGLTNAEVYGPSTGRNTGLDGEYDWIRIELVNQGTTTAPIWDCTVTFGSKVGARVNRGKLDHRFLWKGSISGATVSPRGDGVTPSFPIAEAGGVHVLACDIDVPATTSGNAANWTTTYPGQYSPGPVTEFDLVRYMSPVDGSASKLHGKGNLLVTRARVLLGITITGATEPTMAAGTCIITVKRSGVTPIIWEYNAAIPTAAGVPGGEISPTSVGAAGVVIGTDHGVERLIFKVEAVGGNIVAGRYRVLLEVMEV